MNLHIITGRLTRDPEIATTQKGTLRARFTLAVNRPKRAGSEEDAADFFNCICFAKRAEFVEKYIDKGMRITVNGSMHDNSYEKDGTMIYGKQTLFVNEIEFADGKRKNGAAAADGSGTAPSGAASQVDEDGFVNPSDEEIEQMGLPFC